MERLVEKHKMTRSDAFLEIDQQMDFINQLCKPCQERFYPVQGTTWDLLEAWLKHRETKQHKEMATIWKLAK